LISYAAFVKFFSGAFTLSSERDTSSQQQRQSMEYLKKMWVWTFLLALIGAATFNAVKLTAVVEEGWHPDPGNAITQLIGFSR
jgi:hypothetical protein